MMTTFFGDERQLRGNLHTHTTRSDGRLSLEDCAGAYRQAGYDFICVTDHRVYFEGGTVNGLLILPGEEFMYMDKARRTAYHIVGIDFDGHFETGPATPPQEDVDGILARGGIAVMGHPAWSLMSHSDILEIKGVSALEIYSGVSDEYSGRGDSTVYADVLATCGAKYGLLGVDDMHFAGRDMARAFIMLNASEPTREKVRRALDARDYYASEGPLIKKLTAEGGSVRIETTPVKRICFMTDNWYNKNRVHYSPEGDLTNASYELTADDNWLRIEGTDAQGRKFTTNYFNKDENGNLVKADCSPSEINTPSPYL